MPASPPAASLQPVRLKTVALPAEHGGWGMLGEPLLLGLLVAPSRAGLGIALAAAFAFLARHPLKLAIADWRARRRSDRTRAAERFVLAYGTLAVAGLVLASGGAGRWWLPLALAAPLALLQLAHDVRNQGRQLLPELLGGVALGAVATAEMLAAGWEAAPAFAAWGLMAAKSAGAVLYVRARLRRDRGVPASRAQVAAVHALGVVGGIALALARVGPWLAVAGLALLLGRALRGLWGPVRKTRPQAIGFAELACGVAFTALVAAGYALGS